MLFKNTFKALFAVSLLVASCTPGTQKPDNSAPGIWKRQVTRDIDMSEKEDTVAHHLKNQSSDTTLAEMIISAVKAGDITAYSNIGAIFSSKLGMPELNEMMASRVDTIVVTDPVTGKNETKIVTRDFQYQGIHNYRILEEWAYNPASGKTEIRLLGIAPLMQLSTESYSGIHAMFWLRYEEDARAIIAAYEQLHPDNTLASHIWSDYFQSDIKPK